MILVGTDCFGNGVEPFLRVVEFRIDIEDDAAEREEFVADHLTDGEFRFRIFSSFYSFSPSQLPYASNVGTRRSVARKAPVHAIVVLLNSQIGLARFWLQ